MTDAAAARSAMMLSFDGMDDDVEARYRLGANITMDMY